LAHQEKNSESIHKLRKRRETSRHYTKTLTKNAFIKKRAGHRKTLEKEGGHGKSTIYHEKEKKDREEKSAGEVKKRSKIDRLFRYSAEEA